MQLETLLDLAKERNNNKILKLNIIKTNSQRKIQNKTLKCKTKWSKMWGVSTDPTHPPGNANPAFIIAASTESEGRELQL